MQSISLKGSESTHYCNDCKYFFASTASHDLTRYVNYGLGYCKAREQYCRFYNCAEDILANDTSILYRCSFKQRFKPVYGIDKDDKTYTAFCDFVYHKRRAFRTLKEINNREKNGKVFGEGQPAYYDFRNMQEFFNGKN